MDFIGNINRAFHPAQEIRDPHYFVGRINEIKQAIYALREESSFLAIWGNRGAGKSSLARQLLLIAQGDKTLVNAVGLNRILPDSGFNFLVHYVFCDRFTKNVEDLLKRVVYGDQHCCSLFEYTKDGEQKKVKFERAIKTEGGLGIGSTKIGASGEEKVTFESVATHDSDVIQQFKTLLGAIRANNQGKQGILIIVDEFDVLGDKSGFSSIIKSCSDDYVKFCVAGISSDLKALLGDHASIARQLKSVNVKTMTAEEMAGIIQRAEKDIAPYKFSAELINELIRLSEGFPYFVHLLAKESAIKAFEGDTRDIGLPQLHEVLQTLRSGHLASLYEELYQVAVKHSPQREILLKAFADSADSEIYSTNIYELVKGMEVSNPSQLMKELTAPEGFEPILVPIRDRYYRFSDPVFRTYVKLRNWKFS